MQKRARFDWLALGMVILITAFFALTARFNSQPAPSFVPTAVLSATGCGLLVTALRKLRGQTGVGLLEAGLGGFFLALFQFAVALTYPGITTLITTTPAYNHAFLLTWGLIGLFAVVLSIGGAALGHLAFAPLRPLPVRAAKRANVDELDDEEETSNSAPIVEMTGIAEEVPESGAVSEGVEEAATNASDEEGVAQENGERSEDEVHAPVAQPKRSLVNYAITVLLLGLLPMVLGYVFAAAYDFLMNAININQVFPALYPTLGLLSGLLPWRIAVPINLATSQGSFILFALLWRIPDSALGNPNVFDIQALEPLLLNAAALALLLITMYGYESHESKPQAAPWSVFIGLEALLGLIMVLPSALWLQRGLEGVLQFQTFVTQLPTIQVLNSTLFILNLVTGPIFCILVGLIVRRQYQLWTQPRVKIAEDEDAIEG